MVSLTWRRAFDVRSIFCYVDFTPYSIWGARTAGDLVVLRPLFDVFVFVRQVFSGDWPALQVFRRFLARPSLHMWPVFGQP